MSRIMGAAAIRSQRIIRKESPTKLETVGRDYQYEEPRRKKRVILRDHNENKELEDRKGPGEKTGYRTDAWSHKNLDLRHEQDSSFHTVGNPEVEVTDLKKKEEPLPEHHANGILDRVVITALRRADALTEKNIFRGRFWSERGGSLR